MNKKQLLFVIRHCPYGNLLAREGLDALLAASVYEQALSVLFLDDGVFQLLRQQITEPISQKNCAKLLSVFPLYEINAVFVCRSSLRQRRLTEDDICIPVKLLSTEEIRTLMRRQDQLLSF